ncbi:hypothetical protein C8J57DRAFT_1651550 [Mycena rebaudengoi]|nr:hypothetical protein C8J57DRAFT_1651550 [Mycena rebaudengoi]
MSTSTPPYAAPTIRAITTPLVARTDPPIPCAAAFGVASHTQIPVHPLNRDESAAVARDGVLGLDGRPDARATGSPSPLLLLKTSPALRTRTLRTLQAYTLSTLSVLAPRAALDTGMPLFPTRPAQETPRLLSHPNRSRRALRPASRARDAIPFRVRLFFVSLFYPIFLLLFLSFFLVVWGVILRAPTIAAVSLRVLHLVSSAYLYFPPLSAASFSFSFSFSFSAFFPLFPHPLSSSCHPSAGRSMLMRCPPRIDRIFPRSAISTSTLLLLRGIIAAFCYCDCQCAPMFPTFWAGVVAGGSFWWDAYFGSFFRMREDLILTGEWCTLPTRLARDPRTTSSIL